MDRMTWSDRFFQMQVATRDAQMRTCLLQTAGETIGFVSMHTHSDQGHLWVDEVGLAKCWQGKKVGGVSLRFAFTCARHSGCRKVRLNALSERESFYESFGFKRIPGREPLRLDNEVYFPMEKEIVHDVSEGFDPEI
jgi:GNAT superfamily N-acetyltransferase